MQINNYNRNSYKPNFEKFIKIKATPKEIEKFRNDLKSKNDEIVQLGVKHHSGKKILYLFTGKDTDKFWDIGLNMHFGEFRRNIEKYYPKKPQKMSIDKAIKKLENGYFDKKNI